MAAKINKIDILGVGFSDVTFGEALRKLLGWLNGNRARTVFTPNPEFVLMARNNPEFRAVLNKGDLVIPDGVGILLASKLGLGQKRIKERVTGYDLIQSLFDAVKDTGHTVYFYGGAPGVAELAKLKMEKAHPGLRVVGVRNGYLDSIAEDEMISEIKGLKPDILLVCTGAPRQELWINRHKKELPCKLLIGSGGSLDGMSGVVKRAPSWVGKMGLEWFYRLLKQPSRIKRQIKLPAFMALAVKERVTGKRAKKTEQ